MIRIFICKKSKESAKQLINALLFLMVQIMYKVVFSVGSLYIYIFIIISTVLFLNSLLFQKYCFMGLTKRKK